MPNEVDLVGLERDGYTIVEEALSRSRIDAVLEECAEITDRLIRQSGFAGELSDGHWTDRLVALTASTQHFYGQHFDISLPPSGAFNAETPVNTGRAVFAVLADAALLDLVAEVVGPEIVCNPTQHLRMKLPSRVIPDGTDGLSARVPWHQDNGVLLEEADESHVLTVWIPLNRATIENGCLSVVPGSHRRSLLPHCPEPAGWAIPGVVIESLPAPLPLEMEAGSVLLMHQRTVHGSLENGTEREVRVSLDLRYQPVGEPSGRPLYPSFLLRSRQTPERVVDHQRWEAAWRTTRIRLAGSDLSRSFFRWGNGGPLCA